MGNFRRSVITAVVILLGYVGMGAGPRAYAQLEFDGRIPIAKGKLVYRFSKSLSGAQQSFLEQYGGDLFLDPVLGTLRFFSPTRGVQLYRPGEPGEISLSEVALRFMEESREVFNIRAEHLLPAEDLEIDSGHRLLIFRQVVAGVPINGAAVRVVITGGGGLEEAGLLKSVKAFALRDLPDPHYLFAPKETIEAVLAAEEVEVTFAERQYYFPRFDPTSVTPVWYARGTTAEGDPMAYFLDARTGELLEKREVVSELGTINGTATGFYPDPKNVFATANQFSKNRDGSLAFFPVAGARVSAAFNATPDNAVTAADGSYELPIKEGTATLLQCALEYGRCGEELQKDPNAGETCLNPDFKVHLRAAKAGTNVGCEMDPAVYRLAESSGHPVGDKESASFLFNADAGVAPPALLLTTSLQLMAFHHVREAIVDMLNRISSNGIAGVIPSAREVYPVTVAIPFVNSNENLPVQPKVLHYRPDVGSARICLTAFIHDDQAMTPTLILHEAAGHHAIALITGALQTKLFDCVPGNRDCIEQSPDPRIALEGLVLEGFADTLAAYAARTPKFGYYDEKDETKRGSLSYDITSPTSRFAGTERGEVAKGLWNVRERFTKLDLLKGPDLAADLLYRFLAQNRTVNGTDRVFDPAILLNEILSILDRPGFTRQSDGNRDTRSDFDLEVLAAFSGLKISEKPFIRGDANQDLGVDLSDAIWMLSYLFDGSQDQRCLDAMDIDSTGDVNLTDPIYLLGFSFLGGPPPAQPFPFCNVDLDPENEPLSCKEYGCGF